MSVKPGDFTRGPECDQFAKIEVTVDIRCPTIANDAADLIGQFELVRIRINLPPFVTPARH